jgi:hypothetical protein
MSEPNACRRATGCLAAVLVVCLALPGGCGEAPRAAAGVPDDPEDVRPLLPGMTVPATYVVGTDGVVRFMCANPNYRERLSPELLRTAARLAVAAPPDGG